MTDAGGQRTDVGGPVTRNAVLPLPDEAGLSNAKLSEGLALLEIGVLVRIGRRAGAEEAQRRLGPNDVRGAGRQQDRIARPDFAPVAVHLDLSTPIEDEINLLSLLVMMALCGLSRRQRGLGQALVLHRPRSRS